jgi:hypothetical protein
VIRLTWRQFRTQATVVFAALSALAIVLAITGSQLDHLYDTSGIPACKTHHDCGALHFAFLRHDSFLHGLLGPLLLAVPALLGIFWGAPLVARELETGTYRLVWTQTVTRTRWFAVKAGLIGLASIAVAGLLSFTVTWWASPFDRIAMDQFRAGPFDERGIVAVGYAAFAFALGLTTGTIVRRTLPAMAATLIAFVAARLAMTYRLRRDLIPPAHKTMSLSSASNLGLAVGRSRTSVTLTAGPPNIPNAWVYSSRIVDNAGQTPTSQSLRTIILSTCPNLRGLQGPTPSRSGTSHGHLRVRVQGSSSAFHSCITRLSAKLHEAVAYQPASRYWTFQSVETAIFLAAALILVGASFWWIRRRLT